MLSGKDIGKLYCINLSSAQFRINSFRSEIEITNNILIFKEIII